jgi:hypothetical protein
MADDEERLDFFASPIILIPWLVCNKGKKRRPTFLGRAKQSPVKRQKPFTVPTAVYCSLLYNRYYIGGYKVYLLATRRLLYGTAYQLLRMDTRKRKKCPLRSISQTRMSREFGDWYGTSSLVVRYGI